MNEINHLHVWGFQFGVMIDSYNTYLCQSNKAQSTLEQCAKKISSTLQVNSNGQYRRQYSPFVLQLPIESIRHDIGEFIHLPIRYVEILNDLCQSFMIEYANQLNSMDWNIIQGNIERTSSKFLNKTIAFRYSTSFRTSEDDSSIIID